ncbi:MAG: type IV pilus twitching motility protein PilT [bacterium]|nr:type IV pilus twitching motility protein PilT [bacterium]
MVNIDELLNLLIERKGSDLHLKVNRPPLIRIYGRLIPTEFNVLTPQDTKDLVYSMLNPVQVQKFERELELDLSYTYKNIARFRVNVFRQRGVVGAAIRMISYKIPTIDELGLPSVLKDLASKDNGFILITGPAGCGKSTTLASLIDYINNTRECHIITIEDPIEFVYQDNLSAINQREIELDTRSFKDALKHILRQDPDVILIGEMRDFETMSIAITAAETGHLVFSTLHTNDATQSINRIIDSFPVNQQQQVRIQLSLALQGIISQRLLNKADGSGRVAAVEIMINSPTIKKLIEEGKISEIHKAIESSVLYYRMQTIDQSLVELYNKGLITFEEALSVSVNAEELKRMSKGIDTGASQYYNM